VSVRLLSGRLRRATAGAAGFDLYSTETAVVGIGCRRLFGTGVRLEIDPGYVGLIRDRSGLALRQGLTVLAGVIDSDFRLEVGVLLLNTGDSPVTINSGDRIGQILFLPISVEVEAAGGEVSYGFDRDGGFGSTGQ
jgi:dUTP pyrophosphatase